MFETSVIHARAQAAGGRLSLLTLSIIAHSAVVVGAIAYSVATVEFPLSAPDAYENAPSIFIPVSVPPPLGRPDGGKTEPQQPQQKQPAPAPQPAQITAPSQIPEQTTVAEATGPATSDGPSIGTMPGPVGEPDGVDGSIGHPNAIPIVSAGPPVEEKIYQSYEVKAPVLLHKVAPPYPQSLVRIGMSATVVVRCIIDKNGRVRNPQVVVKAMQPFEDAVIDAVQQWRYTPASLQGQAVDSYLDVKVTFSVRR